ncbi:hypothetical protein FQN54_004491 [Arachnomyces sp. PD_36]|nr:hypothetical protein FQN54_004491 [Arachnomyces sp. PD_36]
MLSKPPIPYAKGWKSQARSHTAPPPTPVFSFCCTNDERDRKEYEKLTSLDRCLLHPPLKGLNGPFTVDLEIHDTLHAGEDTNAQVVTVNVLGVSPSPSPLGEGLTKQQRLVAKIYDPLYFPDEDGYLNPFLCVDKHYTHEAAAYSMLSNLQGTKIPNYYGSYTLSLPVVRPQDEKPVYRRVRLILIEFINGQAMRDVSNPKREFSQADRQKVMKEIVDFDTNLYAQDIRHSDIHPRNVLVTSTRDPNPAATGTQRNLKSVTFIDFGAAEFGRIRKHPPDPEYTARFLPGVYISPLLRWHACHRKTWEFQEWIDWDWQPWLEAEYEHTEAAITPQMRYIWLPDFLLRPPPNSSEEE